MIDCKDITPIFRPIEKLIYDAIDSLNLRTEFATDKHARELANAIALRGYNPYTFCDIVNYNAYIFEKYNVDLFKTCLNIKSTGALYNLFLRDEEVEATDQDQDQEEPEIVNVTLIKSRTNTTKKAIPPMVFNRTLGKFVQYEEPEIVNYKACWEALRDHVDHVIDRLSENKESSHNASALSAYLDISNQMKFIEELDLNSHWTKLSTADKIKALQNVDIQ